MFRQSGLTCLARLIVVAASAACLCSSPHSFRPSVHDVELVRQSRYLFAAPAPAQSEKAFSAWPRTVGTEWGESLVTLTTVTAIALVGLFAGSINSMVGSGGLLTFPLLVSTGLSPVSANIANNLGVLPGILAATFSYRCLLRGEMVTLGPLLLLAGTGGVVGALLLLSFPPALFEAVVPFLILFATALVLTGPAIKRAVRRRTLPKTDDSNGPLSISTFLACIYGGYFGAGQGILLLAYLNILLRGSLHRANAYKNAIVTVSNGTAAVIFVANAPVEWAVVAILAVSSSIGGALGGRFGQLIPEGIYRVVIGIVGILATLALLAR
jgi:uncharacterized protein